MQLSASFIQALQEMAAHKLRTALTLLGMVFGVGAVIAMLSIGEGAEREAMRMIDSMGLRNIEVRAREFDPETLKELREDSLGLSMADLRSVRETLPFIDDDGAEKRVKTYSLFSLEGKSDAAVVAVTPSMFSLSNFSPSSGRMFTAEDNNEFAQVAVLGAQAAQELFPSGDAVGKAIKINHLWLEVVGILADKSLGADEFQGVKLGNERNQIFVPLKTAKKRLKFDPLEDELDAFRVQLSQGVSPQSAASALSHLLERRHNETDDFELVIPAALLAQQKETQRIFTIVMACVAGISLLVGGIGIMNIMLATVLERTGEIGLLRALGARKADIQWQFLVESFTVSAAGALLGIVFGVVLASIIQQFADWPVAWAPSAILLAVSICLITGVVFGYYPARRAAELDPIKALQSD